MSFIPVQWNSLPEWMRKVADAVNPLVKKWPNFSTPGSIGYETGAGGIVTQATSKATGVTLNKVCGEITLHNASLAAGVVVSFVLTDSQIEAGDNMILNHVSGGTFGAYGLNGRCGAGAATIDVSNRTGGALAEAIVIRFLLLKGVTS